MKLADFVDFGAVFDDPIVAGQPAIQVAVLDVAADFLRPDQPDQQLLVIDIRRVRAAADLDMEAGLGHFGNGGLLQTAFGQSQF